MSFGDIELYDWFKRFFGGSDGSTQRRRTGEGWFGNLFTGFDEMRRQMERRFEEQLRDIQTKAPKELIREYQTPEVGEVRQVGPIVYGYSATIGPDGKPKIREFGNVKSFGSSISGSKGDLSTAAGPQITAGREPLTDVIASDKEVKVIVELPSVNKESIKVNASDSSVEISAQTSDRKYRRVVDLLPEADTQTARSNYRNGILEIVFNKKQESKPKGTEIKVE